MGERKRSGIPVWFYILRPFVFSDWTRIPGLHQDCKGIMDCVIIVSGLWSVMDVKRSDEVHWRCELNGIIESHTDRSDDLGLRGD